MNSAEHHFAHAALRHYEDAVLLHDGARLPNADHHFGFAVECALKSLLLRFAVISMGTKPNGKPASKPWSTDPTTGKVQEHGHLPELATDVSLLMHGRSASGLTTAIAGLSAFATWSVHDRYLDGSDVAEADVRQRRTVAENILALHDHALLTGRLP
ncbi:hypothetical protein [Streptomyces hydrogenans]|uniref:hypothetical protein n=1 Tax=Streptomyces hydrogenans TaxID=1873719 RepID=UPI0037FD5F29